MIDGVQNFEIARPKEGRTIKIGCFFIQLKLLMLLFEVVSFCLLVLQLIINFTTDVTIRIIIAAIVVLVMAAETIAILVIAQRKNEFKVLNARNVKREKQSSSEEISQEN